MSDIRHAVLADWAVEIPEQYTSDKYSYFADVEEPVKLILVEWPDEKEYVKAFLIIADGKLVPFSEYSNFAADAISAHYGIPIMRESEYKRLV